MISPRSLRHKINDVPNALQLLKILLHAQVRAKPLNTLPTPVRKLYPRAQGKSKLGWLGNHEIQERDRGRQRIAERLRLQQVLPPRQFAACPDFGGLKRDMSPWAARKGRHVFLKWGTPRPVGSLGSQADACSRGGVIGGKGRGPGRRSGLDGITGFAALALQMAQDAIHHAWFSQEFPAKKAQPILIPHTDLDFDPILDADLVFDAIWSLTWISRRRLRRNQMRSSAPRPCWMSGIYVSSS